MENQVYKDQIEAVLPRVLAYFDNSKVSKTFGIGDRQYWGWKLIDFPNATFQGAVHGLARLVSYNALPFELSPNSIITRVINIIISTKKITRSDGSLEEAFPYESSYCVTALVAYDFLSALLLLEDKINKSNKEKMLAVIRPMIGFLVKNSEHHAIISNHLATAVAALVKWDCVTGENTSSKQESLLSIIYQHQSLKEWEVSSHHRQT